MRRTTLWRRTCVGAAGGAAFLLLAHLGSDGRPVWHGDAGTTVPALGSGIVSGVFMAAAATAAVLTWRRHAWPRTGWGIATGVLIAAQSILVTLIATTSTAPRGSVVLSTLLVAAAAGLVLVVVPLAGLRRSSHVLDDGFATGMGAGMVAAAHLLGQVPVSEVASRPVEIAIGIVLGTHVGATALVLRHGVLSRSLASMLVLTVAAVFLGQVVHAGRLDSTVMTIGGAVAIAAVGAAWLVIAWTRLARAIEEDRCRIATFERAFVRTTRLHRERMHELRSTVSGLANGTAMLDRTDVPAETRARLWGTVRRELDRMERLLSDRCSDATDIDLDEALGLILDLQRLKGRHVELRSNGDVVRANFDALAEVVNILMDNAATHGGSDSSLVEVVRHDESSVDIKVTDFGRGIPVDQRPLIFSWGARGADSPGEGIGLNLAQRLVHQDGGSLRLADEPDVGSSFVINLPAARRPLDDRAGDGAVT